jgi:hypothetical protein
MFRHFSALRFEIEERFGHTRHWRLCRLTDNSADSQEPQHSDRARRPRVVESTFGRQHPRLRHCRLRPALPVTTEASLRAMKE